MNHKVIMISTGQEIIGIVLGISDHTITLKFPCSLPELEGLVLMGDYIIYAKDDVVTFNRDTLIAEYTPRDDVVNLYLTFLNHDLHKMSLEMVTTTIQDEIDNMNTIDKIAVNKLRKLKQEETADYKESFGSNNPKVVTVEDVINQLQEKLKKKLN